MNYSGQQIVLVTVMLIGIVLGGYAGSSMFETQPEKGLYMFGGAVVGCLIFPLITRFVIFAGCKNTLSE